jgi:hypothetical protein
MQGAEMLAADVKTRLAARIPALANRLQTAADLSELLRQKAMPQAQMTAFILPLSLRAVSAGDAMANAFTQMVEETVAVLLVVKAAGDATGGRALPSIDTLVDQVIAALCGWSPAVDNIMADFRLVRGALLSADAGDVIYQIDFALQKQIRIIS